MNATPKQLDFISSLKAHCVATFRREYDAPMGLKTAKLTNAASYALLLALPEPQTLQEASEIIDVLKLSGGVMLYGRQHQAWGQPILAHLAAQFGQQGERLPATFAELETMLHA